MKIRSWIKRLLIFGGIIIIGNTVFYGQNALAKQYLKETGDFAQIYSGEVETIYNPFLFENNPYYISQDFTDGEVVYRGIHYPGQKMRLDLYRGNLVLLVPGIRLGVLLDPNRVDKVYMYEKTIIYHIPPVGSGLKTGYYFQLYDGKELQLLGRHVSTVENINGKVEQRFSFSQRYFVVRNGEYHQVKNRKSFIQLFPEYKKQIKRFVKENNLTFKADREYSMTQLTRFCEEMNHQSR